MSFKRKKNIGIIITLLLFILILLSGCVDLRCAYIKDSVITDGWNENTALSNTGTQFLGIEKWCSSTYEINGRYPASITVTTSKTLILTDESEIQEKTIQSIEDTFQNDIQIKEKTLGERTLNNNHKTKYVVYDGIDTEKNDRVKIIGEVWNCQASGQSIICIGVSYITNKDFHDVENLENWKKIVMDTSGTINGYIGDAGLIDNVICH